MLSEASSALAKTRAEAALRVQLYWRPASQQVTPGAHRKLPRASLQYSAIFEKKLRPAHARAPGRPPRKGGYLRTCSGCARPQRRSDGTSVHRTAVSVRRRPSEREILVARIDTALSQRAVEIVPTTLYFIRWHG